ncbi:MAG: PBP1A family penicillin-binding protein [Alphaproteobacteria bacterium]|nr:PBP1A family penicillin-binding protein [Alphaproteobacteria bacterium]OJU56616.1 MAG: hypothetical protein BGO00_12095 [Alphaproteobacteria bacterium 62-8]
MAPRKTSEPPSERPGVRIVRVPLSASSQDRPPQAPKRKRSWPYVLALLAVWGMIFGAVLFSNWIAELPDISGLMARAPSHDVTLLDAEGRFIARRGLTHGALIDAKTLPPYVSNAFIAIEDRRFRSHFGVDPKGLLRAAVANLTAGAVVEGGSTITQQLAKNLFLKPKRTFSRKAQEALLAVYLEARYSKDQILTLYLNRIYFGAGVYGIEAAAERFFNKPAADLTLVEAAMLAGSVKAPARYNPLANTDASVARAATVLHAMAEEGLITPAQERTARATRPRVIKSAGTPNSGYFADWVIGNLSGLIGDSTTPVIVRTTLDLSLQAKAERAVEATLSTQGPPRHAGEAALVAMTPQGAVRAMVGGRAYRDTPFNRASDALRQPGSAFKPFVYLTALEHGYTADEVMDDKPVQIGKWQPSNYEGRYEGPITLTRAFAKSSNSVAVQLTNAVGARAVAATAHRLGISARLDAVPALALGVSAVSPLEMTGAYAAIANGGNAVAPYGVSEIRTRSGKLLYRRSGTGLGRVMSPTDAARMTGLMSAVVHEGTGRAAQLGPWASAGKTGTTQDFHDAWFIGFTADYVCGVWMGNDNNAPMKRVTGGGLPAHVFHDFMLAAEEGLPPRPLNMPTALADNQNLLQTAPPQDQAGAVTPQPQTPENGNQTGKADSFESILDRLFGGT